MLFLYVSIDVNSIHSWCQASIGVPPKSFQSQRMPLLHRNSHKTNKPQGWNAARQTDSRAAHMSKRLHGYWQRQRPMCCPSKATGQQRNCSHRQSTCSRPPACEFQGLEIPKQWNREMKHKIQITVSNLENWVVKCCKEPAKPGLPQYHLAIFQLQLSLVLAMLVMAVDGAVGHFEYQPTGWHCL